MTAEWVRADGQGSNGRDVQMTRTKLSRTAFALAACCSSALLIGSAAHAANFSAEYVFGASLSDVGNVYPGSSRSEPARPCVRCRFSNRAVRGQGFGAGPGPSAADAELG